MTTITRTFDHHLEAIKGWYAEGALDKSMLYDTTNATNIVAGRVGHLDGDGLFVPGPDAGLQAMPLFLLTSASDYDVDNAAVDPDGNSIWQGVSPSNVLTALVATGGYEVQTTEFESESEAGYTYYVNTPLTAAADGKLTPATNFGTDWIVGICSTHEHSDWQTKGTSVASGTPLGTNAHGKSVLTFWTYFLPAFGTVSSSSSV